MKKKIILSDADGVMVWWKGGFDKFMEARGYAAVPDTDSYLIEDMYNVTSKIAHDSVREFNVSDYIEQLDAYRDAAHYISVLHKDFGYKFHVITSLSDEELPAQRRLRNLHNLFGKDAIERLICLPQGASKYQALSEYEGLDYFWLEDHPHNASDGLSLGLHSVMFNHPYNRNIDVECPRIDTWRDFFYDHFLRKHHD